MKIQEGRVSIEEAVEIGTGGQEPLLADIFLPPKEELIDLQFYLFTEEGG